jgi:uncharacterized DUF497 family protein
MITFEWNHSKAKQNQRKHGVSFEEAQSIFYDEFAIQFFDKEHSNGEERFLMLGLSNRIRLLIVVHCVREKDIIRIISARPATRTEQKFYRGPEV